MSFEACIRMKVKAGKIERADAEELIARARELESGGRSPARAAKQATEEEVRRRQFRRLQRALTVEKLSRIGEAIQKGPQGFGPRAMMLFDPIAASRAGSQWDPNLNVPNRQDFWRARFQRTFAEGLEELRRGWTGHVKDQARLDRVVDYLHEPDKDFGDAAAARIAKAWQDTSETARLAFVENGGDLKKRQDWALPQTHDEVRTAADSKQTWVDFELPLVRKRTRSPVHGGPMTDPELRELLGNIYDSITSGGLIDPEGIVRTRALANRRADPRILRYNDGAAWRAHNARYGSRDALGAMTGFMESMARDIGLMEVLGPNPDTVIEFLARQAQKTGKRRLTHIGPTTLRNIYDVVSGRAAIPENLPFAYGVAAGRNFLVSTDLGGAMLSATGDFFTSKVSADFAGMPYTRVLKRYLKLWNPRNEADRRMALRLGLIMEGYNGHSAVLARNSPEGYFLPRAATGDPHAARTLGLRRLAQGTSLLARSVLRLSGLEAHTDLGRWAFGMEMYGFLAEHAGQSFDALPKATRHFLELSGWTPAEWDLARLTGTFEEGGATWMSPATILEHAADNADVDMEAAKAAALRLHHTVRNEVEFAVPSATARARAIAYGAGGAPGTLRHLIGTNLFAYRMFGVSVVHTHVMRALAERANGDHGRYLARYVIATVMGGALAAQLKMIADGKDPEDMTTGAFWGKAALQGGGFGILGDFIGPATTNRFGQSFSSTLAGRFVSAGDDVAQILKSPEHLDALIGVGSRYVPGSRLWYARLAYNRLIVDELRQMADPAGFRRRTRRQLTMAARERNQRYWWPPAGEPRAPDLGAVAGGSDR